MSYGRPARGRWRKRAASAAVAAALALAALALPGGPAQADQSGANEGPGLWVNGEWEGAYVFSTSGGLAWCFSPDAHGPWGVTYEDAQQVTSWQNDVGNWLSPQQINALGYVLSVYGVAGLSNETATAVRFLVYDLGGYRDVGGLGVIPLHSSYDLDDPGSYGSQLAASAGVRDLALAIKAEALANSNNWDGTGSLSTNFADRNLRPGEDAVATVTLPGIGAGKTVVFQVTAPDGSVSDHEVLTDGDSTATFTFNLPADAQGLYELRARIDDVPAAWPSISTPRGNVQNMIMGSAARRSWADPDGRKFRVASAPSVTTATSAQLVSGPTDLFDRAEVTGGVAGEAFTGATSLYGPFESNEAALGADLAAATPVGSAGLSGVYGADGAASVRSNGSVRVTQPGYYVWVERLDGTDTSLPFEPGPDGRPPETTVSVAPGLASKASVSAGDPGDVVSDTVTLSGLQTKVGDSDVTWTLSGGLYGPVRPGGDSTCATADWSGAALAVGVTHRVEASEVRPDGTATLSALAEAKLAGLDSCWGYAWTLTGRAPDGSTVKAEHKLGDPAQTVLVRFRPEASTKVSSQLVSGDSAQVNDQIQVTGGVEGLPFTGETALYGPFESNEAALSADLSAAKPAGRVPFGGVYGPGGKATVTSPWVKVEKDGFYVFVETLDATPASTPKPPAPTGRPPETTLKVAPTITSAVSARRADPGAVISDTVRLSGLVRTVGGADPEYVLRGGLYGPVATGDDLTCATADWSHAVRVADVSKRIVAADIPASGALEFTGLGSHSLDGADPATCWGFAWTLTASAADGSTVRVEHPLGDPAQTALVTWQPRIATTTSAQLVSGPTDLSDALTLTGGLPDRPFKGESSLYGPFASDAEALGADVTEMTPA
ncbi:MAG: hypothetical protein LBH76_01715, partial [Propionibacteriaceae bacterium]|nr:hypothetical protein [Propionibacteriaceae bacterium]